MLHSQTGNGIIEIGNAIIWTIQWDSHWPVDNFRLWNFFKSPFLAKDIEFSVLHSQTGNGNIKQEMELSRPSSEIAAD